MNQVSIRIAASAALMLGLVQQAHAAGTLAGTDITNQASVDFTVGGVNQNDVNSNVVTFETDRRINLTVAEVGGAATNVVPGSTGQVLTFTVTNHTNGDQDFRLGAVNFAGGTAPFGGTDNFNPSAFSIFVDANNNGTYESGTDTATYIDELGDDDTITVFIVGSILNTQVNGDISALTLTAYAANAGVAGTLGADATATVGAESPSVVDTVFGDAAGDTDGARDGAHSDQDQYNVVTATITVNKTSRVVSDPFNGTTDPKAIPGAVIEYCIQVTNTGGAAASNVITSDPIPANTAFVTGSIVAGGTVTAGVCNADGTAEDDNNTDPDETDPNGGAIAAGTVTTRIPSVATGATVASRFRVTIQ